MPEDVDVRFYTGPIALPVSAGVDDEMDEDISS